MVPVGPVVLRRFVARGAPWARAAAMVPVGPVVFIGWLQYVSSRPRLVAPPALGITHRRLAAERLPLASRRSTSSHRWFTLRVAKRPGRRPGWRNWCR